ncbi:MAG: zinc-binding dehydrogenase [Candidatus Latescibacteria bacterium]|nr:zinc-binding dehydrogenase [Candidatus Latescibacterota bacterium]
MSSTITAAVMVKPGKIELQDFVRPEVADDAFLLKVQEVGVCGSDKHMYLGHSLLKFPVIPGHELLGTVEEMGRVVNDQMTVIGGSLSPGDRITVTPSSKGCGRCYNCIHFPHKPALCPNRTVYGFATCAQPPHLFGGFSQYMYIHPKSWVFKIPETLSDTRATLIEPSAVATRAVERAYAPGIPHIGEGYGFGKRVLVVGAGPIGLLTVAALRHSGAGTIIVTDLSQGRLDVAKRMGADIVIQADGELGERVKHVRDLTDGVGPDIVMECAGVPAAFKEGLELVRRGGKLIEVGHYSDPGATDIRPHVVCQKEVDILGVWAYPPLQFQAALSFLSRCTLPLEELVTHRMSLERLEEAMKITGTEGVFKVVIEPYT